MPTTTIPTETNEITEHRLWGFSETIEDPVQTLLWGHLYRLAHPVVSLEHGYPSDLYRDALWIDKWVTGPCVFFFAVHEFGTHIGMDARGPEWLQGHHDDTRIAYRIELFKKGRGDWWVSITRLYGPRP